jgi:cation diffusion facilitator CzcD-associated flavoprotein CzcO
MLEAVIIGAGMSGLLAAIKLQQAGISDFVILEKMHDVGGTWAQNTYPGCACDVPSHLYSYSFELNPNWSRHHPLQAELLAYYRSVAAKHGLIEKIRFGSKVAGTAFDSDTSCWQVEIEEGKPVRARNLIFATGQLSRPQIPTLKNAEVFGGKAFHSANWDHDFDFRGKRVAVIGNGPSAVQFVPEIAPLVDHLVLFQRTANWFLPRNDRPYSTLARTAFRNIPGVMRLHRAYIYLQLEMRFMGFKPGSRMSRWLDGFVRRELEKQVPDPQLRAKLTPDYLVGCKRGVVSDDFLPALRRENVALETAAISHVTKTGIVTADGVEHAVDAILYGTGFEASDFLVPMKVTGPAGRDLHEQWKDGAEAFNGLAVAGFPNMFILYGPNTNSGHTSIIFMIENQVNYMVRLMQITKHQRAATIEVKPAVMAHYNDWLQSKLKNSIWVTGCRSWYLKNGKVTQNWPLSSLSWKRRLKTVNPEDFSFRG